MPYNPSFPAGVIRNSCRSFRSFPKIVTGNPALLKCSNRAGFTLIELLVVVLIIGILSAAALPQYQLAVDKARLMSVLPFGRSIKDATERYYLANGEYPPGVKDLDIDVPADCTQQDITYYACGSVRVDLYGGGEVQDVNVQVFADAVRLITYKMYLDYAPENAGRKECIGYEERGKKVCRSVCGADTCWAE